MNNIIRSTVGALAAGMLAAACTSSSPPSNPEVANASIDNAAQAVNRAAADPRVAKYAPTELERAQNSLQQAQTTWKDKGDEAATSHLSYLAHQHAVTAMELANRRAAEDAVKVASVERDRMLASAGSSTAKVAKSDQQLQQELSGLPAQATERGIIVTLPQERFAVGKAELPADTGPMLDHLASVLKNNPGRKVAIEGYTDSEGSKAYNMTLSKERADAVREALISHGIDANRIIMRSYGEDHPVASNTTSAGRRENRRAEIVISDVQGHVTEPTTSSGQ